MTNAEARCNISLRPRKPEGSLGRTAQDGNLDSHTAPELCDKNQNRLNRDGTIFLPPPPPSPGERTYVVVDVIAALALRCIPVDFIGNQNGEPYRSAEGVFVVSFTSIATTSPVMPQKTDL